MSPYGSWRSCRSEAGPISLVLAGALVPYRVLAAGRDRGGAAERLGFVIPDVSSAERNWLLKHAELVLYPTSAEGFGLIPHEAAAFGTPTVMVPFGPFAERLPDLPVAPPDWGVKTLADACLAAVERSSSGPGPGRSPRGSDEDPSMIGAAAAAGTVQGVPVVVGAPIPLWRVMTSPDQE